MPKRRQYIESGAVFGYWTVIDTDLPPIKTKRAIKCRCKCGTEKIVLEQNILSKKSTSCGCLQKERASAWMQNNWKKKRKL